MRPFIFVILMSLVLISCGDDTTGPATGPFSLEVQVQDSVGSPVEGLSVAVWNFSDELQQWVQDYLSKRIGATRVAFSLPQTSICSLNTYDLEGHLIETTLDGDTLLAGERSAMLGRNLTPTAGVEVYRYELIVQDVQSGEELFRDSKYMTLIEVDHTRFQNGKTDASGRYYSEDRMVVPGLYDLPEMAVMDANGMQVATFALDKSLRIRLYDDQGKMMEVRRTARDGKNVIKVIWAPQAAANPSADPALPPWSGATPESNPASMNAESAVPQAFKLSQNFPNPFG